MCDGITLAMQRPRFGYGRARARSRGSGRNGLAAQQWAAVRDLAAVAKASLSHRSQAN